MFLGLPCSVLCRLAVAPQMFDPLVKEGLCEEAQNVAFLQLCRVYTILGCCQGTTCLENLAQIQNQRAKHPNAVKDQITH